MNLFVLGLATVFLLVLLLFFFSLVDSSVSRISLVSLRVLAERRRTPKLALLEEIAGDRTHFLLPLHFGCQVLLVVLAVLITTLLMSAGVSFAPLLAMGAMFIVSSLFRQLIPRLITQSAPDRVLLRLIPIFRPFYQALYWMSAPLRIPLKASRDSRERTQSNEAGDDEPGEEEIQAYLEVGEEEGIIEGEESELIQSALEFADTLAREIMTPRIEIVSIDENATVSELRSLMVSSKFSRIPVYRKTLDEIVGVVYLRNLLTYLDKGQAQDRITSLINRGWFVPETKRVSELLKEMQRQAEHMAVVINEYGSVSGLVTIEDVIEEIVGEIRDEDQLEEIDLTDEGNGRYLVRGGTDVEELEKALAVDLGELDVATVSGLIVAHLGKVPVSGETVVFDGLFFEIVSSDRKKIQTMRVRKLDESIPKPSSRLSGVPPSGSSAETPED